MIRIALLAALLFSLTSTGTVALSPDRCSGCSLGIKSHPIGPLTFSVTIIYGQGTGSGSCTGSFPDCQSSPCNIHQLTYKITAEIGDFRFMAFAGDPSNPSASTVFLEEGNSVTMFFGDLGGHKPIILPCNSAGLFPLIGYGDPVGTSYYGLGCTSCPDGS